jgi:MFS family permease
MTEDRDARRNYAVLLGQGVSASAATELTSLRLVLPFLYATAGAPVLFAGMLVPVSTLAKRLVQVLVAPMIKALRPHKRPMALASILLAAAVALISLTFNAVDAYWLVPIFLFAALTIGAATGLGSIAFQVLIGGILSRERRQKLLFTQSSLAGLIVVIVAVGSLVVLKPGTSLAAHQELIWLGIGLFLLSALLALAIREPTDRTPDGRDAGSWHGEIAALRQNFRIAFALPWFNQFLIVRTLYLSIELAIPFFSIHAASFHGNSISGLNAFVIAANIGLIAGGFLWVKIGQRSLHLIMILAASLTCLGGLLAMAIELRFASQSILWYAIVFVLVSLGTQGVKNGRTLYLLESASDDERPFCIAVSNLIIGIVAIAFGGLLGALASFKGVAWPILALIVLNVLAAVYTLKLHPASGKSA